MKLYVVVRKDLKKCHQAVQGGHALAELLLNKKIKWTNGTLVYLSVKNEQELLSLYDSLPCRNKAKFEEPYWDNSMTAFAAYGSKVSEFLKKLPLL